MRFCRSRDIRMASYLTLSIFVLIALMALAEFMMGIHTPMAVVWGGIAMFTTCVCCFWGMIALWKSRKYELTSGGITISYFQKFPQTIRWDSISEVAVCKLHFSTRGGYETVIRIAMGEVFAAAMQKSSFWTYERYSMKYHKNIIIIDYDDAIREEFEKICPVPIQDCR